MSLLEKHLEDKARFARIKRLFYIILGAIAVAEIVLPHIFAGEEHHFAFEGFPAFGSLYGLVSCVAIIILSKLIGKAWLMRRENYYDH